MTQVGEGRGAGGAGESMTFGTPAVGEILAERYQLEQHIDNDSSGRQVWCGVDVILRRPVAVIMRYPGAAAAAQMLQAAVAASRIVHPNLVGVYDAIDEEIRAYVVREWVDGAALRDHIAAEPFDPGRATTVAHAVAAAVTAVHSTGMTHGNIHPGTVLIGADGRVVLSDASADGAGAPEDDVRAVGAVLYFALTGYWPHAEVSGPAALPDAPRAPGGGLAAPRQVRAGVPDHLDNLTMDLLDPRLNAPAAEVVTGEFARIAATSEEALYAEAEAGYAEPDYQPDNREAEAGPIRFAPERPDTPRQRSGRKIALGVGALVVIGVLGLVVGIRAFSGSPSEGGGGERPDPVASAPAVGEGQGEGEDQTPEGPTGDPTPIDLSPSQLRIVDTGNSRDDAQDGVELVVDGDLNTGWRTQGFNQAPFGNLKPGMGILIDLGEPRLLASVAVDMAAGGASAELRSGDGDPGNSREGDEEIIDSYELVGEPFTRYDGTRMVFSGFEADVEYQHLMVWFTELPPDPDPGARWPYRLVVQQVTVQGY